MTFFSSTSIDNVHWILHRENSRRTVYRTIVELFSIGVFPVGVPERILHPGQILNVPFFMLLSSLGFRWLTYGVLPLEDVLPAVRFVPVRAVFPGELVFVGSLALLVSTDVLMAGLNDIVEPPVSTASVMYGQVTPEPTMLLDFIGCQAPMSGVSA